MNLLFILESWALNLDLDSWDLEPWILILVSILSATESRVLEALGCSVMSINEHGRREALKPTMFFMPHCEAELYNNLLQANWKLNLLKNMVLFGNSFETYEQHVSLCKNSPILNSMGHILAAQGFTNEFRIQTVSDDYYNAFHDSSWHFFSPLLETELPIINSWLRASYKHKFI